MYCSNCGKEISDQAKFCGFCGHPTPTENAGTIPVPEDNPIVSDGGKPKKKKGAKVAIICCVVLFVLIGLGVGGFVLARTKFENSFHRLFDKPKEYYLYVEKKNAEKIADGLAQREERKSIDLSDCNVQETMTLKLGSKGKDYVNLLSAFGDDLDFAWLDSVGISFSGSIKDQKLGSKYSPILNGVKLGTGDVRFDLESGEIYGGIPELSSKYFGLSLKEILGDYESVKDKFKESFGTFSDVADAAPDQETMEKMASKYYDLIMENLDEKKFTKSKEELSCGKDSVDCTVITVSLKQEDVQKVCEAVVNEMMEDEDLEKLIRKTSDSMAANFRIDGDKVYQEFLGGLKKSLEDIEKIEFDELSWKTYVDKEGLIVGRYVDFKKDDKPFTAKYAKLEKNDATNLEFSVTNEKTTILLSGNGKTENGLYNGEYDYFVDEKNLLTFAVEDYDLESLQDGRSKGAFIIKLGEDFDWYGLLGNMPSVKETRIWPFLSQMTPALKIKFDVTDRKHSIELVVMDGKDELLALAFDGSFSRAEQVQMPEDVILIGTDTDKLREELIDYLIGCDTDGIFENLEAAKVPEKWWKDLQNTLGLLRKYYR